MSNPKRPEITLHEILNTTYSTRWIGTATELHTFDTAQALVDNMEGLEDLSTLGWGKLRGILLIKGNGPGTINRKRSVWRVLCQTAVEMGAIPSIPRTRPERTQEKPARFLSAVEESRVLSILHPRERELCVILLYTGMRKSELWGLTWEDIDWETGLIQVHQTKSGKRRFLPITSRVRAILEELQEAGKATPACSININTFDDHFRNACKTARVLGVSVHTLRHTYASRLAQNGVSLLLIQKLLGHSSASTTLVYAHLVEKSFEDAVLRTFEQPEE